VNKRTGIKKIEKRVLKEKSEEVKKDETDKGNEVRKVKERNARDESFRPRCGA
jgi:hypothetical protein